MIGMCLMMGGSTLAFFGALKFFFKHVIIYVLFLLKVFIIDTTSNFYLKKKRNH